MDNRTGEMEVFVSAAELQSFSAAGRRLKLSPSAVSKLVTRIEDRLGTRLLVRSTRMMTLTPEGKSTWHGPGEFWPISPTRSRSWRRVENWCRGDCCG